VAQSDEEMSAVPGCLMIIAILIGLWCVYKISQWSPMPATSPAHQSLQK
jgi:hypothetical protein